MKPLEPNSKKIKKQVKKEKVRIVTRIACVGCLSLLTICCCWGKGLNPAGLAIGGPLAGPPNKLLEIKSLTWENITNMILTDHSLLATNTDLMLNISNFRGEKNNFLWRNFYIYNLHMQTDW